MDTDSMLIVATRLIDTPSGAKLVVPIVEQLQRLPKQPGCPQTRLGGAGCALPGKAKVRGDCQLVILAYNLNRMHRLPPSGGAKLGISSG